MANTRLEMFFINQAGKKSKLSIDDPRPDLNDTDVEAAMQTIIDKNIFDSTGGDLVAISSARILSTDITDLIEE